MFEFVRRHNKIMQIVLFLLIFPSFVLFGIDGYNRFRDKGNQVAEVDGVGITQQEWDFSHRQQIERMRAQMPNVDVKLFDTPYAKFASLEGMVQERTVQAAGKRQLLDVSDQRLAQALQQDPTIASLRKPDGSLDLERYRQLAAAQGLTPEGFESRMRQGLIQRQVIEGVADSAFMPDALARLSLASFLEKREIQVASFEPLPAGLKPTDDDLKAYLQSHQIRYQRPQTADIEYVVLDLAQVEKDVVLPEADVRTYYEQNAQALQAKEERRSSHILINAPKGMAAAERAKAKEKAQHILDQVKKQPKDFAKLAAQFSQDPGSAAKGGDLDYAGRGVMVKPFEDALFALKPGAVSDLVESEFGYHIIMLKDIRKPAQKTFEQVRPELEKELRRQQAQRKFAEVAEQFSNLVYEQADSLKPVAERLKLTVQHASGVTPQTRSTEVWAQARVLSSLFSADSVERKHNTEAIETGPSQLVSARLVNHNPARSLTLEEARAQVTRDWAQERAAERARAEGAAALKAWKDQPRSAKLPAPVMVTRAQATGLPPEVIKAAMEAPANALPQWLGVDLGAKGYAVVKVNQVAKADITEASNAERDRIVQTETRAEIQAYLSHLKAKLGVQYTAAKPAGF
jgi:peptidyl-prolyl cis-trans isomerase D